MEPELKALGHVAFRTAYAGNDIWRDDVVHVDGIHSWAFERTLNALARVRDGAPVGNIVIEGRPGIGKSHFLGRVRHAVVDRGQIFVLFQPSTARQFWNSLALAYVDALHREVDKDGTQLRTVLHGLGGAIGLPRAEIEDLAAGTFDPAHLKAVRRRLQVHLGRRPGHRVTVDVAIALILTNSEDLAHRDIGDALIQGLPIDVEEARAHSIRASRIPCREVVGAFDRLAGAAGCTTLVAVDQLDGLLALGRSLDGAAEQSVLHEIANGLMDLAEDVQHSLIVLSCLADSWALIRDRAVPTAHARYPTIVELQLIPSAEVGKALVAAHLREAYGRAGFMPRYPTWPVRTTAFDDAILFSPRSLITVVQDHCVRCRENSRVTELEQLPNERQGPRPVPDGPRPGVADPGLDRRFGRLVQEANVAAALDEKTVDHGLPPLLRAGLTAWAKENAAEGDFSVDPPPGTRPLLHARLRRIVDADTDDEVHWSFRAVLNASPVAALNGLRAAVTASGLEFSGERRRLFVLRNAVWSRGPKTQQVLDELRARGGSVMMLPEADLTVFRALQQLLEEQPTGLVAWLREHRHASRTKLLAPLNPEPASVATSSAAAVHDTSSKPTPQSERTAPPRAVALTKAAVSLTRVASSRTAAPARAATPPKGAEPATTAARSNAGKPSEAAVPPRAATPCKAVFVPREADEDSVLIGIAEGTDRPVTMPLEDLRRHTVIFAGSGSGKTVLIRRLVEECALKGVSAVVLDPNNDLARLGLAWPEPPEGWLDGDAKRAASYLRDTEVVVWTPRLTTGRPLSFAPLAGLGDVAGDAGRVRDRARQRRRLAGSSLRSCPRPAHVSARAGPC